MNRYTFNYNADPKLPKWREENLLENKYVKVELHWGNANVYFIDDNTYNLKEPVKFINDDSVLMLIPTTNTAHSISEIIDFSNFYKKHEGKKIAITKFILSKMPFLFQLMQLLLPEEKFIILEDSVIYKFQTVVTYRCVHMIQRIANSNFDKFNNILTFHNLQNSVNTHSVDLNPFLSKIEEVYKENKHKYTLHDNIMLLKTSKDTKVFSKDRCMEKIDDSVVDLLEQNQIKVLSVDNFSDIVEYICVFYHAKNVIVSYGGIACTNRFFCNPSANVILIANLHYKPEYDYGNTESSQTYWHIRSSHLFLGKKQTVLLDFENAFISNDVEIIKLYMETN